MDIYRIIEPVQSLLFEQVVMPVLYHLSLASWMDDAYDATGTFLIGCLSILMVYLLFRPLERLKPVDQERPAGEIRTDILYTLLSKTGLLALVFFIILDPYFTSLGQKLHTSGVSFKLDAWFSGMQQHPVVAFFIYLLIFDFLEYLRHRLQHAFNWWWSLHAIHHSQQHMTLWTDSRNHLVDGLIRAIWLGTFGLLIGIPAGSFITLIIVFQAIESLSHTNVKMTFGKVGRYLLVSPHFHRLHHAMGLGHTGRHRGCNFAVVFPVWDVIFKTARFDAVYPRTGISDQLQGVDYGDSFLRQQWVGLKNMFRSLLFRSTVQE